MQHMMTNKSDSLRASVILTLDWPGGYHDAKLTLCQLSVTLILCQLNQGFPCTLAGQLWTRACLCDFVYKLSPADL